MHLLVLRDRALLVAGRVARVFFVPIGADPREELRVGRDVPFVARHFRAVLRAAIAVQAEAKIEAVDVVDGVIEAEREQLRIRLPVAGGVARRQVPRGIQIYVVEAELLERAIARACVVEALGVYVVGDFANERALVEPTEATAVLPATTVRAVIAVEAMEIIVLIRYSDPHPDPHGVRTCLFQPNPGVLPTPLFRALVDTICTARRSTATRMIPVELILTVEVSENVSDRLLVSGDDCTGHHGAQVHRGAHAVNARNIYLSVTLLPFHDTVCFSYVYICAGMPYVASQVGTRCWTLLRAQLRHTRRQVTLLPVQLCLILPS